MPKLRERLAGLFNSASSTAIATRVDGDTHDRLAIDAGGRLTWGSGSATGETNLYRSAADSLMTDDRFTANAGLTVRHNGYALMTTASDTVTFAGTSVSTSGATASVALTVGNTSIITATQLSATKLSTGVSMNIDYSTSAGHGVLTISRAGTTMMTFGDANSGLRIAIGGSPVAGQRLTVYPTSTTEIGLAVRGVASQSANLMEWQTSAGARVTAITASGQISTTGTISVVDGTPRLALAETGGSAGSATFGVSGLYPTLGTRDALYTLLIDGRAVPVIDTGSLTPTVGGRTGMQWITGGVIRQYNGSAWVPLAVPSGGTTGQILVKSSDSNYATAWATPAAQVVTASTSSTSAGQILDSSTGKAVKFVVVADDGTKSEAVEILAVLKGATVNFIEYGRVSSASGDLATYDVSVSAGSIQLLVTPSAATATTYIVSKQVLN